MSFITSTKTSQNGFALLIIDNENSWPGSGTTERLIDYEIIWVRAGSCVLDLNLQPYVLPAGSICCLAPGQIRRLKFADDANAVYFKMAADFFYQLCVEIKFPLIALDLHHLSRPMIIPVTIVAGIELEGILRMIQKEIASEYQVEKELLTGWLKLFMMYLRRQLNPEGTYSIQSRDSELATRFMQLVAKGFATKKMVSDYARELMVTPNYLNQIVKRVSGFSASHHIQQFLIMEAKRQAVQSSRSMKEIAYALGFDDLSHFSKFFKNKSGTNFSSFKKDRASLHI